VNLRGAVNWVTGRGYVVDGDGAKRIVAADAFIRAFQEALEPAPGGPPHREGAPLVTRPLENDQSPDLASSLSQAAHSVTSNTGTGPGKSGGAS